MPEEKKLGEFEKKEGVKRRFPVFSCRAGFVQGSVWENERGRSVSLQRSYQGKDGVWGHTGSLNESDVPKALMALADAYRFLTERAKERGLNGGFEG